MSKNLPLVKKIIKQYGLCPSTKRDFSLLGASIVIYAYTKILRSYLGFTYRAAGALGRDNKAHFLFNVQYVADQIAKLLEEKFNKLNALIFMPALKIYYQTNQLFQQGRSSYKKEPVQVLKNICQYYPRYYLGLGLYNSLWRYLGNQESKGKLKGKMIIKIEKERALVAALYPNIEKLITACTKMIGQKEKIDGDLLRYFTLAETREYLKNPAIFVEYLKILTRRRQGYFHLALEDGTQYLLTEENDLREIDAAFYKIKIDPRTKSIKGIVACSGKVQGLVYNLEKVQKNVHPPKEYVLVATMTDPKNKFPGHNPVAIITDEGGLLSHAAIIARELKIPCVIGTKIATQVLKSGDRVEVNADRGIVKILKK